MNMKIRPVSTIIVIPVVMILTMFLLNGCKSKTSQNDRDSDSSGALSAAEAKRLRRENARLRAALKDARSTEQLSQEIERLSRENADLRSALEEGNSLTGAGGGTDIMSYPGQGKIDTIIEKYSAANSTEEKLELLSRLDVIVFGNDPVVIVLIESALQDSDVRVSRAGAELLEDFETEEALPTIERALNSNDKETRELAVAPLANIRDPKAAELLMTALNDESSDVRRAAFDSLDEQSPQMQMEVFDVAIRLPHNDVKIETVARLEELSSHQALEILLLGLDDPDPDFRDEVNRSLNFLIDQEFESYEQGLAWWNENRENLDEELFPLDEEVFPLKEKD